MTTAPLSRNYQSIKSTHILQTICARIIMVLIDSHGYSTQIITHAVYRVVVMYALPLGGQQRKMPVTQSCVQYLKSCILKMR